MIKLRDIVIFLSGALFLHTVSHAMLPYVLTLPWKLSFITLTQASNCWITVGSGLLTILLLWWASRLPK